MLLPHWKTVSAKFFGIILRRPNFKSIAIVKHAIQNGENMLE